MALNWDILKKTYTDYFEQQTKNQGHSIEATVEFIELQYLAFIRGGVEIFQNAPLSISTGLKMTLKNAMKISEKLREGTPTLLNTNGAMGVIQIWAGGTMSPLIPPPPAVIPMNNMVTNPGSVTPMNLQNSDSGCPLADELVRVLQQHATTIAGINMGMTSPPANAVIPGIWVGIS